MWLDSRVPDLLIGALVASLVIRGGMRILGEVTAERSRGRGPVA